MKDPIRRISVDDEFQTLDTLQQILENNKDGPQLVNPLQIQLLQQFVEKSNNARNKLAIPTLEGYEIIDIDQIIRCEADRNYSYIFVNGIKQPYLISKNLKELENALIPNGFLRIHNSHLINPVHVRKVIKTDGGMIEMVDHTKIRMTKNKAIILEELFNNITKI
ncbi:LytR/AlgR family response regulator transcription factor [Cyclobacterium roseum]|uniref:LytR/AlgR family response regulator transcription factor n=1 Tax=Cyclobacterium roseum TaxID=2666137 RepID=UPI001390D7FC|nr:LytTR family DNA-binding domain-containing protein [Cyclobacterium roseum]